jgi:hypothetical protein
MVGSESESTVVQGELKKLRDEVYAADTKIEIMKY